MLRIIVSPTPITKVLEVIQTHQSKIRKSKPRGFEEKNTAAQPKTKVNQPNQIQKMNISEHQTQNTSRQKEHLTRFILISASSHGDGRPGHDGVHLRTGSTWLELGQTGPNILCTQLSSGVSNQPTPWCT